MKALFQEICLARLFRMPTKVSFAEWRQGRNFLLGIHGIRARPSNSIHTVTEDRCRPLHAIHE